MRVPFFVLSYGDFQESMKLFSYEQKGIHCLPIFNDMTSMSIFSREMHRLLSEMGDNRLLIPHVCQSQKHARDIFTVLAMMTDVKCLAVDPRLDQEPKLIPIHEILGTLSSNDE